MSETWRGIRASARQLLVQRNYEQAGGLAGNRPLCALRVAELDRSLPEVREYWIPGVEVVRRAIYSQRFRGSFGELGRQESGLCARIGMWPRQWSVSRMFAGTEKGFHIHPPSVPEGEDPAVWFRRLFEESPEDCSLRPYEREQWDLMFVVCGAGEMLLVDEREGLPRRLMRLLIDVNESDGGGSACVLIPPGVAHAVRVEGSADLIMVYGTSTCFDSQNEGRIASGVETAALPSEWEDYLTDAGNLRVP